MISNKYASLPRPPPPPSKESPEGSLISHANGIETTNRILSPPPRRPPPPSRRAQSHLSEDGGASPPYATASHLQPERASEGSHVPASSPPSQLPTSIQKPLARTLALLLVSPSHLSANLFSLLSFFFFFPFLPLQLSQRY